MEIDQQIARVRTEGEALARAAEAGPLDAPVPGCPGWDVEALVRHIGDVHRWAATIVGERIPQRLQRDFEGPAEPDALLVWYLEGCVALVDVLEVRFARGVVLVLGTGAERARVLGAPAGERDRDPSLRRGVGSWPDHAIDDGRCTRCARRMGCAGDPPCERSRGTRAGSSVSSPIDGSATWSVILGEHVEVTTDRGRGHCEVRGTASDLYLWSMNRRGTEGLTVSGDESLLQVWADNFKF